MTSRCPLSQAEKECIYWGKQRERALPELADETSLRDSTTFRFQP